MIDLITLPKKKRRTIDDGLHYIEASQIGHQERYSRSTTPHGLGVWWARRPHAAMKILVSALISKEDNGFEQIVTSLHECPDHSDIKLLDCFGGGGTIPYEGAMAGASAYSLDINPMSVSLQGTISSITASKEKPKLTKQLKSGINSLLDHIKTNSEDIFPNRDKGVINYIWSYKMPCEKCSHSLLLLKRPFLSKKNKKKTHISFGEDCNVSIVETGDPNTFWSSGKVICPKCGHAFKEINKKNLEDICIVEIKKEKVGKSFEVCSSEPSQKYLDKKIGDILARNSLSLPSKDIPHWSGITNPTIYGFSKPSDYFNKRQLCVLLLAIEGIRKINDENNGEEFSVQVSGILTSFISQLVDWNCRISMWISQNEQVGRAFCGPGVPMYWDYVETDPLGDGPSNLKSKANRLVKLIDSLPTRDIPINVRQGSASNMPFESEFFDLLVTDPPYYDNLFYSVLSDFFTPWISLSLNKKTLSDYKDYEKEELVSSRRRHGDAAKIWYAEMLTKTVQEMNRVLKPEGVGAFVFSHSSFDAWECFVQAFSTDNFYFSSAQPFCIERKFRPRSMTSVAINTCLVFIFRKVESLSRSKCLSPAQAIKEAALSKSYVSLSDEGWANEDKAWALFSQGIAALCNKKGMKAEDIPQEITRVESYVSESFPDFRLKRRKSL